MSELSDEERYEATEWLAKMMDQPEVYRADLEAWLSGNETRRTHYKRLVTGLHGSTAGAELTGMRPRSTERAGPWAAFWPGITWRPALTVSAIAIIVAATGYQFARDRSPIASADQPSTTIQTRIGEVRPTRLADGTVVTLDTATEIVVNLASDTRKVELRRGRARFAIADRGTPFKVVEGTSSVVAAAGTFDVSYGNSFTAQVIEGAAEVRLQPAAYFPDRDAPIRLTSGQKLVFTSGQSHPPSAIDARPSDQQWIGGVKKLNDVPIREVIAEANTYSETKIVLADPRLGDKVIFGDLHIRDIDAVAQAIADYLNLEIDRSRPGKLYILAPN
ncbi:hypothetical protein CAF53_02095 [Sphingobium sp. LB126]|uniref:FecR family protein n=1 Tax=Sphingobium sp. LB126 TaxID=1983755 RepID=UPI000C209EA0|nr:FecR domain-containing protein [Sphingobium sp. LB126]PJG47164.1 hypothetical protein CAF53_02095 [Sphingobium sp. LB126]